MSRMKDHMILLLNSQREVEDLGVEVFGSKEAFDKWQVKKSQFFNDRMPNDYMHTLKGLVLVKDHLENIAHGNIS